MLHYTRIIEVDRDDPDTRILEEAAAILRQGGLVAFATETVYGLGADATNADAVARIFAAKGRPSFNPLIVHADDIALARSCVSEWPQRAELLAKRFWPGPLTLVLPRAATIPDIVTAGRETVGVRVPSPRVARELIRLAGVPIAAPSANRSTGVSPTESWHVLEDLDGKVDMVLASGPTSVGIESTVLDLTDQPPHVLRPGTIAIEQLVEALGAAVLGPGPAGPHSGILSSPGQMSVHYAPKKPTFRVARDAYTSLDIQVPWGLITVGPSPGRRGGRRPERHFKLRTQARAEAELYGALRWLDRYNLDFIAIVPPPDEPRWIAIRDRIWRASKPWPDEVPP